MKKIIGILGVAVIATTMFFSANNVNDSTKDISLSSLISLNNANATENSGPDYIEGYLVSKACTAARLVGAHWIGLDWEYVPGHKMDCNGYAKDCSPDWFCTAD